MATTQQPYGQTEPQQYNGYCSTVYAVGPGLPATEQGQCGTVLVVEADAVIKQALGVAKLGAVIIGLHLLGASFFLRR